MVMFTLKCTCYRPPVLTIITKHEVRKLIDEDNSPVIYSHENMVDFNVFHIRKDQYGNQYVPVNYDLDDIIEEHVKGRNPLNTSG